MFMKMQKQAGFTLIELLLVVVIMGILSAVAIPKFTKSRETAVENSCKSNLMMLETAIQRHNFEEPSALTALSQVVTPASGNPGYIKKLPTCPQDGSAYTLAADGISVVCPNNHTL